MSAVAKSTVDRWCEALRSGRYRQIKGRYSDGCGGYCALGVLMAIEPMKASDITLGQYCTRVGVDPYHAGRTVGLNDLEGITLAEIADYIEEAHK